MKSKFARGLIAASLSIGNVALAAPFQKEPIGTLKDEGWFKACLQIDDLQEPADTAGKEWRDHVSLKAACLAEARRDAEAVAFLEEKMARGGRSPQLLDFLGTSQFRLGQNAEAAASFEEALEGGVSYNDRPNLYRKLAAAYLKQASASGKAPDKAVLAKAERYTRLLLETDPIAGPAVYAQLARVRLMQGAYDESISLFGEALTLNASYPGWPGEVRRIMEVEFTMGLGQAYYRRGDKSRGAALMEQAIDIAPTESLKAVMRTIRDDTLRPASAGLGANWKPGLPGVWTATGACT
ncbi:tetratricopeptide repeat protein [Azotobacter chroococcum]|uniref:tetratricopeptide repeat protein n=1 Tax=Azotobacter chroococcum TaxID=353 RepID=UPI001F610A62|nr:tetratricopeptide repeat protein [Azotobacter chroococcum]